MWAFWVYDHHSSWYLWPMMVPPRASFCIIIKSKHCCDGQHLGLCRVTHPMTEAQRSRGSEQQKSEWLQKQAGETRHLWNGRDEASSQLKPWTFLTRMQWLIDHWFTMHRWHDDGSRLLNYSPCQCAWFVRHVCATLRDVCVFPCGCVCFCV